MDSRSPFAVRVAGLGPRPNRRVVPVAGRDATPAPRRWGLRLAATAAGVGAAALLATALSALATPAAAGEAYRSGIGIERSTGTAVTAFCGEPSITRSEYVR